MGRVDDYRAMLRSMDPSGWDGYLAEHSNLPGPRGNLELMRAVADEGTASRFDRYVALDDEYFAACGALGLGRLLAEGDTDREVALKRLAADGRWRVREAVAMALQWLGDADRTRLLDLAARWSNDDSLLVRRAAIAGVCEPRLLADSWFGARVIELLDSVTSGLIALTRGERRTEPFRVLRKALGYCWSVAIVARPDGLDRLSHWASIDDRDVLWMVRENLRKARMVRLADSRIAELRHRAGLDT